MEYSPLCYLTNSNIMASGSNLRGCILRIRRQRIPPLPHIGVKPYHNLIFASFNIKKSFIRNGAFRRPRKFYRFKFKFNAPRIRPRCQIWSEQYHSIPDLATCSRLEKFEASMFLRWRQCAIMCELIIFHKFSSRFISEYRCPPFGSKSFLLQHVL